MHQINKLTTYTNSKNVSKLLINRKRKKKRKKEIRVEVEYVYVYNCNDENQIKCV